ncbi:type II CRISPR RNA-guided endonuclease Cas9, partial [Candidatus Poribacteria bacterium]|nr:type II CRISPR RNA-guided endonuclease Cas9 [Candidatus Poribacteria bacterium]
MTGSAVNTTTPPSAIGPYRLGLDVGSDSLGWAIVLLDETAPEPLVKCGVRIFPAGTDREKSGAETLRNEERRLARQTRRQLERRIHRRRVITRILNESGLLPSSPAEAEAALKEDPYRLRARALREPLTPFELGRALYHLSKRRGFKTNRRAAPKKDDDAGKVAEGIMGLREEMQVHGASTLGEYLAALPPLDERRRGRYLDRAMVEDEFLAIWNAQAPHHPAVLTLTLFRKLYLAIFHQRPLRAQTKFIGTCPLTGEPRAPRWDWHAHEVRLLQEVNNLRVNVSMTGERLLTTEEREQVLERLRSSEKGVTFDDLRKLLNLDEFDRFNLEAPHRSHLDGQKVEAGLRKAFKKRWAAEADFFRHTIWPAFKDMEDEEFDACAASEWGLTKEDIKKLARIAAGKGYAAYSLSALKRLVPPLAEGKSLFDARVKVFGEVGDRSEGDALPRVPATDPDKVRNPVVLRTLAETRKVVNAIIREYGKPAEIVVELARETRGSVEERNERMKVNARNRREREGIKQDFALRGAVEPSGLDITKYRLWLELGGPDQAHCPYTGEHISFDDLFGEAPRFDIEHILPYSRSFDDSFANKTLCLVSENRERKRNKTPHEAYDGTPQFEAIKTRVRHSKMNPAKQARFTLHGDALAEKLERFKSRQLTDTGYAARLIRESLQVLYPQDLAVRSNPVRTTNGAMTAKLRYLWGLNGLLPIPAEALADEQLDPGEKHRLDHRHHAVDALVIALTTLRHVNRLANRYDELPGERFQLPLPWDHLRRDAQQQVDAINVSFAPRHKVSGQFTKETNFGEIRDGDHSGKYVHRVSVGTITATRLRCAGFRPWRVLTSWVLAGMGEPRALAAPVGLRVFLSGRGVGSW